LKSERFEQGMAVRRAVLGEEYVQAASAAAADDDFTQPLEELVTEYCWGSIWTRPGLTRRERSLLVLAIDVALNHPRLLKAHVVGALNNGCTKDDIREALLQATVYCGLPAGVDAFHVAAEAIREYQAKARQAQQQAE
jgi:4-carboxymuconolactone decarboxylase